MVKLADADAPRVSELATKDGAKKAVSLAGVGAVAALALGVGIPVGLGVAAWVNKLLKDTTNKSASLFAGLTGA